MSVGIATAVETLGEIVAAQRARIRELEGALATQQATIAELQAKQGGDHDQ